MSRISIFVMTFLLLAACTSSPKTQIGAVENPSDPLYKLLSQADLKAQLRGDYYAMDFTMPDGRSQMVYCKIDPVRANTYSYYEFYTYSGAQFNNKILEDLLLKNLERKVSFWGLYPDVEGSDILVLTAAVAPDSSPEAIYELCWMLAIDGDSLESRLLGEDVY